MTFPAYKTLITGSFNINRNAIIRNYRIIKGYIKGFKLEQSVNINNLGVITAINNCTTPKPDVGNLSLSSASVSP